MELLSVPAKSTGSASTKVLVLDGTTLKSRTAEEIRSDSGAAPTLHAPSHHSTGYDPLEISQSQVFDSLQLEDGSFLLAENGNKLSIQGVDDIRDLIAAAKTVSASDAILGRKSPGSGFFEELTISDALDFIGASERGDILYRGEDGWDRLPAGAPGQFLKTLGTAGDPQWATVTGTGTVTNVSASGANGVTAAVTNPSTTPSISIGLGAITPTSVNGVVLSGSSTPSLAVTGSSSISGANTGDQTITLTGDVTGTGTGSFAASIGDGKVSYSKIQNVTPLRILGRKNSPAGIVQECTLSEVLDFVTSAAWGDLLYRGETGWTRLPAGTNGQFLKTQGPSGNPVWDTVSAGASGRAATLQFSDPAFPLQLGLRSGTPIDAWPFSGYGTSPDVKRYTLHQVPFRPTNYQWSLVMMDTLETTNSAPTIAQPLGLTLQVKTNLADWTPVVTWDLRTVLGFTSISGTLSLGSASEVYFRIVSHNQNTSDLQINQMNMVLTVWN